MCKQCEQLILERDELRESLERWKAWYDNLMLSHIETETARDQARAENQALREENDQQSALCDRYRKALEGIASGVPFDYDGYEVCKIAADAIKEGK